jgi:protein-S-isoprenylcysteine O-methyltransferase Ste14
MSAVVAILRIFPLLAFAAAMLLAVKGRRAGAQTGEVQHGGDRVPLVMNILAFLLYVSSLVALPASASASTALIVAASGSSLALAGVAVFVRSRAALGAAWSFVPMANQGTGLVTTGPYRLVRHPLYLGLTLFSLGEALAFANWIAVAFVVFAIVPTFVGRALAEEKLLFRTFGEPYADYRRRTRMIIPHLL